MPPTWLAWSHILEAKMVPEWPQNGPKMAPRLPLGGSWGPRWSQEAPTVENQDPRWSQEAPTVEKYNLLQFFGPMLGPKLGSKCRHLNYQNGFEKVSKPTWITCYVKTPIVKRKWACRDRSGQEKTSKTIGGLLKFKVFGFPLKVALGSHLGEVFGTILGSKLRPSWAMLGIKLA